MPGMLDPHRECTTDRRACPFGTMRDGEKPVIDSRKSTSPARRRHGARRVAMPHARTPSFPPKDDVESHWKSVARTLDERTPARIAGGPSCFIQAAKGAMWSPDLKHAPPDR
ncbi:MULTISPECIES: hypothetical protein [Burkholderia cepacia complex]|uniref:hypothetical protein n=1 Tax=Burkholderia cepacia complex TaxID=87882 RepID=UPI0020138F8C|nr:MULTISPECIES: hypothetical protein [Burkholderia cepacia complex]MDN7580276.1 hypothetical protein [Burkholderia orbicola]